jgi:hypothetical protein
MLLTQLLISQSILMGCVLLGWFVGHRIHKFADKRFDEGDLAGGELGRLTDTLSFVGGAVGILLGLLLSFSVAQFDETKNNIQTMGQKSIEVFTSAESFDEKEQFEIRRDLVCMLRSASTADWEAIGENVVGGSQETSNWLLKLNVDVNQLPLNTVQQEQAFAGVLESTTELTAARESLVMGSTEMIPTVVWIVIFFSSFMMTALLAMHLADRRTMALISAGISWGMLAVILLALTVLDAPLAPVLGTPTIQPVPLTNALDILQQSFTNPLLWEECPVIEAATN